MERTRLTALQHIFSSRARHAQKLLQAIKFNRMAELFSNVHSCKDSSSLRRLQVLLRSTHTDPMGRRRKSLFGHLVWPTTFTHHGRQVMDKIIVFNKRCSCCNVSKVSGGAAWR